MQVLYDLGIYLFIAVIRITAFLGNKKAGLWIKGRKNQELKLSAALINAGNKRIWFHCASLGEFEQGRPLIEKIKEKDPSIFIILSFYSPSGYEIRKNYPKADLVCYLPADTKLNAEKFLDIIQPSYVIFIKYEYWHYYFKEIKNRNIPLYIVSGLFRKEQVFFKWYGGFYRNILRNVNTFFVQDNNSTTLLNSIGFHNYIIAGDTRFDRVKEIVMQKKTIPEINNFKNNNKLIVAGSTWPEDEELLFQVIKELSKKNIKIIIAPHETDENRIQNLLNKAYNYFEKSEITRYSSADFSDNKSVLILDTIGILSSVYYYCDIAWIGGGFGKGIHNILEAAAYGKPVVFGPNYLRFREAVDLIAAKGAFQAKNKTEAAIIINSLLNNDLIYNESSKYAAEYVNSHIGATDKIISLLSL